MITSIRQTNEEFFKTFYKTVVIIDGEEKRIPCRYARLSSNDYAEETENQTYPCVSIQDYTPTLKREWYIDMKQYFGGMSMDGLTGYLYRRPVWMEFRYDVGVASKSYKEFLAIQDHFMKNYTCETRFLFNKQLSGEDSVGDIVPYEVRENYIPRTDGVFEINYEFTCSVWVQPIEPEEVDIIKNIIIDGGPTDF